MSNYDLKNFDRWIGKPIRNLLRLKDAEFALLMVSFPVLERWLRGKTGIKAEQLHGISEERFYIQLSEEFPNLSGENSFPHAAEAFWQAFRNGILHQGTFSYKPFKKEAPVFCVFIERGGIPIIVDPRTRTFTVDPYAFAEKVLQIIVEDFEPYVSADTERHNLAVKIGKTTFSF